MKPIFTVMRGSSRIAIILWGIYVLKIPNFSSYIQFLYGMISNLQEKSFSSCGWTQLCPVILAGKSGLWVIMPYARPLTDDEWTVFDYDVFMAQDEYLVLVPVEKKRNSFGILYGCVVAVDYG